MSFASPLQTYAPSTPDLVAEYTNAISGAALFDTSAASKLQLTGPDAPMFLGNLSTNDIKNLPLGGGCETYFCDSRAKVMFQSWIYHVRLHNGRDALWLETTPGRNVDLLNYLDRYLISEVVEMEDLTEQFAQMHLAGPDAIAVLESALADSIPKLSEFLHMERTFGHSATCSIRRRDPLGMPGFDIVCLNERAAGIWRMLSAAGAKPASAETYETLRIEAGTPRFGPDIDESRFVMEVGNAARAVSFSKGCYLGQEPIVMSRDRAGHAPRAFVGLQATGKSVLPAGTKLFIGADEIGTLTSSTFSRRAGASIALGYVKWKYRDVGTELEARTESATESLRIIALPLPN